EVQFFFRSDCTGPQLAYALVSVWSNPDANLLAKSFGVVHSCTYEGLQNLQVIPAKCILSVVAMMPMEPSKGDDSARSSSWRSPGWKSS
ncbi:hypothetical protein BC834DRAFT_836356, partial [Gloeopeniophorella convolvens]